MKKLLCTQVKCAPQPDDDDDGLGRAHANPFANPPQTHKHTLAISSRKHRRKVSAQHYGEPRSGRRITDGAGWDAQESRACTGGTEVGRLCALRGGQGMRGRGSLNAGVSKSGAAGRGALATWRKFITKSGVRWCAGKSNLCCVLTQNMYSSWIDKTRASLSDVVERQ